jgi:chromate transport protein ChrA
VWDWLNIADELLTPTLLVLLVLLTAFWRYWRRERTRGRTILLILVLLATLVLWFGSIAPRLRVVAVGVAATLLMAAAVRFAWSWMSYTGRPEGLEPAPEPLETLEDIVIERIEALNEGESPKEEEGSITKLDLGDRP